MPIVHVNVWEGGGETKAKSVIQGITDDVIELGRAVSQVGS